MPGHLITRAGTHLPDSRMRVFDHKAGVHRDVDWSKKDLPFARIEGALRQVAGEWDIYTDHLIPELTPISDQGRAGTCVANAWCDMLEIMDGLEAGDAVEQLSRRFLYWCARYYTGETDRDGGTYLRSAAHQLTHVGIFEEKYFPYSDAEDYIISGGDHASPTLDHYTLASNNKLRAFYQTQALTPEGLFNELEIAVRSNHPVVFGTPVTKAFQAYRGGGTVFGPPTDSDTVVGSHAMIIVGVGYDGGKRWWLWRNSWSSAWGDSGHVKVNDDYILECRDMWVGTRMGELV